MINQVILMGRLARDPELRYSQSNKPVASLSIAVERSYKNSSGNRDVDFLQCVAWGHTGEFIAKYFTKGDMIAVVGSVQTRKYTDRDGNNRTSTEINVSTASFCGYNKPSDESSTQQSYFNPGVVADIEMDDDELPF